MSNKNELQRREDIAAIGARHNLDSLAADAINAGTSVDEFRQLVLTRLSAAAAPYRAAPSLGLSERDASGFSLGAYIKWKLNPSSRELRAAGGLTEEISNAYREASGMRTRRTPSESIVIPPEIEARRRDLTVGTPADGGYLVGTDHMSASFIEVLRNEIMVERLGCDTIPNCVGDVAVPKKTGAATTEWLAENDEATETSGGIFSTVTGSPHTISARVDISRKLLMQSLPKADQILERDLAEQIGVGVDLAILHGTGADNQPTGLELISGIETVAIGATGGAPTLAHIVECESRVSGGNANSGALAFLTNSKVRGKLRLTFPNTTGGDTPLWTDGPDGFGRLLGYRAAVSNNVRSDLTKSSGSNLSALYYGNWSDAVLFLWGGVELIIDPYSLSTRGALRLVAFKSVDFQVRRTASFARVLDISTAV